jgi:TolB-like protein/Tfp pilus assembly protein PilF
MTLLTELKRRNVIRMAGLYLVGAWLITQVSSTVLPMFDAPAWLPRAIVILLAIAFVPAMVFAWVFELTPEGIKRESDIERRESITPQTGRRMDRMIIVVLLLALAYFGFDKFVLESRRESALIATTTAAVKATSVGVLPTETDDKSIAVLPFADLSPTHDQEYLSDGMAEEILDALAKVGDLKVAGRTSSFYFKGKNEKLAEIGTTLGVANVLEGSVRKQGDKVRVTAQLIKTSSGFHLWSESYDGDLKDVFELQERIARAITGSLKVVLQNRGNRLAPMGTASAEAHEQYLRGRFLWNQRGYDNLRSAEVAFRAALALDSNYVDAWAGLAQTLAILPQYVWSSASAKNAVATYPQALDAAENALRLDPACSSALTARAVIRNMAQFDWTGAERDFRSAIAANPRDVTAHQWLGELLANERRWAESDSQYQIALDIDPLAAVVHFSYGDTLALQRRFDEALAQYDQSLKLSPGFIEPTSAKTEALIDMHRYDDAAESAKNLPQIKRDMMLSIIAALRDPRHKAEAIEQILAHGGTGLVLMPTLLARLGEYDLALTEIEREFAEKAPFREYLYSIPQFEPMRANPRFQVLLKQIGLPRSGTKDEMATP